MNVVERARCGWRARQHQVAARLEIVEGCGIVEGTSTSPGSQRRSLLTAGIVFSEHTEVKNMEMHGLTPTLASFAEMRELLGAWVEGTLAERP